jgi:hypothetical protein
LVILHDHNPIDHTVARDVCAQAAFPDHADISRMAEVGAAGR